MADTLHPLTPNRLPEVAFHAIAAVVLLLFVAIRLGQPPLTLEPSIAALTLLTAGAYWVTATGLLILERKGRVVSGSFAAAACLAAATVVLIAGSFAGSGVPRTVTLWAPLLGLALLLAGRIFRHWLSWKLVAIAIVLAGVGLVAVQAAPGWLRARTLAREKPTSSVTQIRSSLYDLSVTSFRHYTPRTLQNQGGLTLFADRYLLADGSGNLFVFRPSGDGGALDLQMLAYKVPINDEDFIAAAGATVNTRIFRVADVIAQEYEDRQRVYVSHHYWKAVESCWVLRVSSLEGRLEDFLSAEPVLTWKTVFESSPCIPLAHPGAPPHFGGLEEGGRLAWLSGQRLLLTVGDHAMNGWTIAVRAPQEESYSHGKIILIHLEDQSNEIYSRGHRNPQGLVVTAAGQIWSTEHGPQGGDELNRIEQGANYGWPLVSYGTEYGSHTWPLAEVPGSHEGFVEPYYTWVPSIGVSGLLEITSPRFKFWRGDLLVYALFDESFWRLRKREGRIVMTERIPFGERIREVVQGHNGELVVWSDEHNIHFIRPLATADTVSGNSLYRVCAGCHVAPEGASEAAAPSLRGIVGRAVASEAEFEYSPAMRALGGVWSRERLDAFISDSRAFVPGSAMTFGGMPDARSRKALIDYLAAPDSKLDEMPPLPEWD